MSKLLYTRFTKLIINNFLSNNKSIPRISSSKSQCSQDDQPITKLQNTVKGDYKFGMEILDPMISDAIKTLTGYKFYMAKKVVSKNAKTIDEPEEQHVCPVKSRRGKGFMCYGDQVANISNKLKKDDVPRKTRSLTIVREAAVGSKASRFESLKQKNQAVAREGSSAAHNKYYDSSDTDSNAILYFSMSDKTKESTNETDDADESDMDLSKMMMLNKLCISNKRLKGRDWTDMDVEKLNKIVDKIDNVLKRREQLWRIEEYVGGRHKTVNP
nr:hypothetical protein [Tanacetum cinerariifolium]